MRQQIRATTVGHSRELATQRQARDERGLWVMMCVKERKKERDRELLLCRR